MKVRNLWRLAILLMALSMSCSHNIKLGFWTSSHEAAEVAAVSLALDRVQEESWASNLNFSITYRVGVKDPLNGMSAAIELVEKEKVNAVFGMLHSTVCIPTGYFFAHQDIPLFPSKCADPVLWDKSLFPTTIRLTPSGNKIPKALLKLFGAYAWSKAAIISTSGFCSDETEAINEKFEEENVTITDIFKLSRAPTTKKIWNTLNSIRERARIVIICHKQDIMMKMMLVADELGMTGEDFAFIHYGILPDVYTPQPWLWGNHNHNLSHQEIQERKKVFRNFKQVTIAEVSYEYQRSLVERISARYTKPSWNSSLQVDENMISPNLMFVMDAVYMYAMIISEILDGGGNYTDGKLVFEKSRNRKFEGVTGRVALDDQADRDPDYWLWHCPPDELECTPYGTIGIAPPSMIVHEEVPYWGTSDKQPPSDTPICGFRDDQCLLSHVSRDWIIVGSSAFIITIIIIAIIVFMKRQAKNKDILLTTWQINFGDLNYLRRADSHSQPMVDSYSGSDSTISQRTQMDAQSAMYRGTKVAVIPLNMIHVVQAQELNDELRIMKGISHENVNQFIGACMEPPNICLVFTYCSKGNLMDILENTDIKLDWLFQSSLMMDLVNGMIYLHGTDMKSHGNLKSTNCLVDSRWVLKISGYGLQKLRSRSVDLDMTECERYQDMLWTAPEILRLKQESKPLNGTPLGDVYSFSIIMQEILYRSSPFFDVMEAEDIVSHVKNIETTPFRPVPPDDHSTPSIVCLMRDCWHEDPVSRPSFQDIRKTLKTLNKGRHEGVMDNMIMMLEKYANNLEDIVHTRTAQLMEEKKRTEHLLYQMLPPAIADQLQRGESVQPVMFEAVTIYFSDIVGFTNIASKSTPIEVVALLNDLYTVFDKTIEKYDVYKVETIGDAYMVVSGLQGLAENGHAVEIADMALALLEQGNKFTIRHRPEETLSVRIGIHTGPSAAGVVGLTMPRYCLFGDAVNMASRMESTGEAHKIHISEQAKLVLEPLNKYHIEFRGHTEIKGKGKCKTYWLHHHRDF